MKFDCRDDIIQMTPEWKGERFDNGRPRVPDDILRRIRNITFEEAWSPLWQIGYKHQWECGLKMVHDYAIGKWEEIGKEYLLKGMPSASREEKIHWNNALMDIGCVKMV